MRLASPSAVRLSEQSKKFFVEILDEVLKLDVSLAFRQPVAWKTLGLLDYPSVIKRPMDLATLRRLVEEGVIRSETEFFETLDLIWENCQLYNHKNLRVHRYSTNCQKLSYALERRFFSQVKQTPIPLSRDTKVWRYVPKSERPHDEVEISESAPKEEPPAKKRKTSNTTSAPKAVRVSRRSLPGLLDDGSLREPTHAERAKLVWKMSVARPDTLNQILQECGHAILESRLDKNRFILDTELLDKELFWKLFTVANN